MFDKNLTPFGHFIMSQELGLYKCAGRGTFDFSVSQNFFVILEAK